MSDLIIKDLHVNVETEDGPKEILKGVDLEVKAGEVHAIMGPNGSGKSTLAYALAGHPNYEVTKGSAKLDGIELTELSVDERAKAGLFMIMQYPVEVSGVSMSNFLRTAKTALTGEAPKVRTWPKEVRAALEEMDLDPDFASRSVNEGFSGGEKKRSEVAQLKLLNPKVAILDEVDSGLDIDAIRTVAKGINNYVAQGDRGLLIITHYSRILNYVQPTHVHVYVDGQVVESGGKELANKLEEEGYDKYLKKTA